jgi:hypothetical protein
MQMPVHNKLNEAQINLIKSFKYLHNEQEIDEIDSLINFYLEKKLDEAIAEVETKRNYTSAIYEQWLGTQNTNPGK